MYKLIEVVHDFRYFEGVPLQVGLDNCTDADTRLSYVTTEVLVQKLIHRGNLDAFTHIVLDEVHERDQHTDFALLIVKKLLYTVSRNVKVSSKKKMFPESLYLKNLLYFLMYF